MIVKPYLLLLLASFASILIANSVMASIAVATLEGKKGQFVYERTLSNGDVQNIPVHYFNPKNKAENKKIVFVMHGMKRNATTYRKAWIQYAKKHNFILLVPELSREYFPGRAYNMGNVITREGDFIDPSLWSFKVIENIFDQVVKDNVNLNQKHFYLYGHSAGSQFVHRLMTLSPSTSPKVKMAISANAGWYTMLDKNTDYPYGLKGVEFSEAELKNLLASNMYILLGTEDNDPHHRSLRRTSAVMPQGEHRLARGINYFEKAKNIADKFNSDFTWRMQKVEGVGHSNRGMSEVAAQLIATD